MNGPQHTRSATHLPYLVIDTANTQPILVKDSTAYGTTLPIMASNSTPTPYAVSASTEANSDNAGWRAFNKRTTDKWTASTSTGTLRFDYGAGVTQIITRYRITGAVAGQTSFSPRTWTFEGSNDGTNFTVLDTQTNVAAWTGSEVRSYVVANTTAYRYYRLNVSANQGGGNLSIVELDLQVLGVVKLVISNGNVGILNYGIDSPLATPSESLVLHGDLILNNSITTPNDELILEQTGDFYGSSRLRMRNRINQNGPVFEIDTSTVPLDFGFSHPNFSRVIRFEGRGGGNGDAGDPSWHIGGSNPDIPTLAVGDHAILLQSNGGSLAAFRVDNNTTNRSIDVDHDGSSASSISGVVVDVDNASTGGAIGVDVSNVTATSGTVVGQRIAAPSGGANNYALQLSDTGGGTSGGITFGTDVQLYRSAANTLTLADADNLAFGTTTGTKIGTVGGAAGQKIAFYGSTPIVQPVLATGAGATVDNVITALQNLGLVRQS